MDTIIVTKNDIKHLLSTIGVDTLMSRIINELRQCLLNFKPEMASIYERSGFIFKEKNSGLLEWMPIMHHNKSVTIKIVSYIPSNPNSFNLPTVISNMQYYNVANGHLEAIVDGTILTAIRTGAASAVATEILMHKDSKVLGLIGCGAQNVTQLHALSLIHDFQKVLIYDNQSSVMESFTQRASDFNSNIQAVDLAYLLKEADVICTATSVGIGDGPIFSDGGLKPWLHINAVGSDFPGKIEIPLELLQRSLVIPDFKKQALKEGECQQLSPSDINDDLCSMVKNSEYFNQYSSQSTIFDSTGYALEDNVAIEVILDYAQQYNLGQKIALESLPVDPRNPYDL